MTELEERLRSEDTLVLQEKLRTGSYIEEAVVIARRILIERNAAVPDVADETNPNGFVENSRIREWPHSLTTFEVVCVCATILIFISAINGDSVAAKAIVKASLLGFVVLIYRLIARAFSKIPAVKRADARIDAKREAQKLIANKYGEEGDVAFRANLDRSMNPYLSGSTTESKEFASWWNQGYDAAKKSDEREERNVERP